MTETHEHPEPNEASTGELISRLSEQVTRLVREELRLAQLELQRKGKSLGVGAGMAGAAVVLIWFAVAALVCAAIAGIALVLPVWASALIVAAVLAIVAAILALFGRNKVKQGTPPLPEQAIAGSRQDIGMIKEHVRR
jgi:uncharacterized membrane protein YqjE